MRTSRCLARICHFAALAVAAGATVVVAERAGALERLELLSQDARIASGLGRRPPRDDVVIAWIDQDAMDYVRKSGTYFPWPRSVYEQVLDYLGKGGAKAVVFDVLFTEPGIVAEDDRTFGEALARAEGTVAAFKFVRYRDGGFDDAETARMRARGVALPDPFALPQEPGFTLPIPEVEQPADWLGFANVRADEDKTFRRYDLLRTWQGRAYPSLALAAALAASGAEDFAFDGENLRFAGRTVPVDAEGRLQLAFRGPPLTFQHVQLVNILESILAGDAKPPIYPAERFKDKIVLIGINAEGYADVLPTPLAANFPGVELHATALDDLLQGDPLRRADVGAPLAAAAAVIASAVVFAAPGTLWPALGLFAVLLLFAGASAVAFAGGVLLPTAAPLVAALLGGGGSFLWRLTFEGRKRRELKRAFTSYMAPEVVAEVMKDPDRVRLGGEAREVTLLFTDLAGFTGLAEHLQPDELVAFLNDYFTRMCDHVLAEHGVIDKFIGDAIMAMFGAPMAQPDHAARAVRAATGMLEEMARIDAELRAAGRPAVQTRIGIHTGVAVVGNMGSRRRFDYTAIGDTVNLASRLEGANKAFGTRCLVSEATWRAAAGAATGREVGRVQVKGRAEPVTVFEPCPAAEAASGAAALREYAAALAALRRGDPTGAAARFAALDGTRRGDAVVQRYRTALADPLWDGVFVLDEK